MKFCLLCCKVAHRVLVAGGDRVHSSAMRRGGGVSSRCRRHRLMQLLQISFHKLCMWRFNRCSTHHSAIRCLRFAPRSPASQLLFNRPMAGLAHISRRDVPEPSSFQAARATCLLATDWNSARVISTTQIKSTRRFDDGWPVCMTHKLQEGYDSRTSWRLKVANL